MIVPAFAAPYVLPAALQPLYSTARYSKAMSLSINQWMPHEPKMIRDQKEVTMKLRGRPNDLQVETGQKQIRGIAGLRNQSNQQLTR